VNSSGRTAIGCPASDRETCVIAPDQQADIVAFAHLQLRHQLRVPADARSFAIDRARPSGRILRKANVEAALVALVVTLGGAAFTNRAATADLSHYADIGAYRACEPLDEAPVGVWLVRIPIAADYSVGTGPL
jgi:hypothetical protein